ncbi:MAG: glycosyltransferase family 2 protein [Cyanobacteria bacterium P01_H01_bin.130]
MGQSGITENEATENGVIEDGLISVIIPVFNGAATLPETVRSLQAQTDTHWEAVIVDDGSTDDTGAIAQGLAREDSRIRVVSQENSRQAIARNYGLTVARGSLIAFLDADDWWTPEKLADQRQALADRPAAGFAYSWTDYVDDDNRLLHPGFHLGPSGPIFLALLANNFIENGSNPLVRRSLLEAVGGFESQYIPAEDWDMWLKLAARCVAIAVPKGQVRYRVSATSSSASLRRLEDACVRVLERHIKTAPPPFAAAAKRLKRPAKARFYKGLACKALTVGSTSRQRGINSARLLGLAIINQPRLLGEIKFLAVMAVKIALILVLSVDGMERSRQWFKLLKSSKS